MAGTHAALLGAQPPANADGGSPSWGEDRSRSHQSAGSSLGATGAHDSHDGPSVPDPTLQTPLESSSVGATPTLPAAAGAVFDAAVPASEPAYAADLGSLDLAGGLQQAIETLHATIELAARQGISQARIALRPQELGAIRIHLTQTTEGLLARVTADTPAAAQALAAGHTELRQSLSALGLNLTRLHIEHGGQPAQREGAMADGRDTDRRAGAQAAALSDSRGTVRVAPAGTPEAGAGDTPAAEQHDHLETLTSRALVDVLV